jgi:hypothetical protein
VKKLLSITAILLSTVVSACGQPPNPLLGKWALSMPPGSKSAPFCFSALESTSTTQTLFGAPGKSMTEKVNYIAAQTATCPTTVYVTGDAGNHTTYEFSTKDKMLIDISALCTYQRQ